MDYTAEEHNKIICEGWQNLANKQNTKIFCMIKMDNKGDVSLNCTNDVNSLELAALLRLLAIDIEYKYNIQN